MCATWKDGGCKISRAIQRISKQPRSLMQTKPQINIVYVSQLLQADESLIPETELILSPISPVGNTSVTLQAVLIKNTVQNYSQAIIQGPNRHCIQVFHDFSLIFHDLSLFLDFALSAYGGNSCKMQTF